MEHPDKNDHVTLDEYLHQHDEEVSWGHDERGPSPIAMALWANYGLSLGTPVRYGHGGGCLCGWRSVTACPCGVRVSRRWQPPACAPGGAASPNCPIRASGEPGETPFIQLGCDRRAWYGHPHEDTSGCRATAWNPFCRASHSADMHQPFYIADSRAVSDLI